MKLRWKTFTIISVAVVSLIGILSVVTCTIMMENVTEMEQKTASQSINRVLSALSNELDALDATTQDYAAWDDTYAFVQNGNTNYINLNLMDATFTNLRLNVMLFVNTSDQVVFGKAYDLNNGTELPVSQSWLSHLATNPLILHHDSTKSRVVGTILLPEGPLLVASRPILDSNQQGPIRGTLVTGRFLDATELEFLSKTTQLSLAVQSIAGSPISSDFQTANSSLSQESPVFVQPLSNEKVAGYALLEDAYGNPILILRADMPRDIYAQGLSGTFYTTVSLVAIGVAFGLSTMFLVEKFVISRLTRLSAEVSEIERTGNLSVRVSETGKDELSGLGEEINRMLSALGQTQQKLKEERDNAQRYLDIVGVTVIALDRKGQIILLNREGCRLLGCPSEKILARNWFDNFVPARVRDQVKTAFESSMANGIERDYESPIVTLGGEERLIIWHTTFLRSSEGRVIGTLSSGTNVTDNRLADAAFRESEGKYRTLVENSLQGIAIVQGVSLRFVFANSPWANIFGYTVKELTSLSAKEIEGLVHPEDRAMVFERLADRMKGKPVPQHYEFRGLRKDRTVIWLELSSSQIEFNGQPAVQATVIDRTRSKKAEERLKQSEAKYRTLVEDSLQGIVIAQGFPPRFVFANHTMEMISGYSVDELLSLSPEGIEGTVYPEDRAMFFKLFTDCFEGKPVPQRFEFRGVGKSGVASWAEISFRRIEYDGQPAIQAVFVNVDERKKMEDALRESEEKLRNTIESSPDGIALIGMNGKVVECNQASLEMFGYAKKEEMIGQDGFAVISSKDRARVMEDLAKLPQKRSIKNIEVHMVAKDGREFVAETSASIIRDASGSPRYVVTLTRDITERKQMEQRIVESEERLRRLIEYAPDAMYTNDLNGVFMDGNKQAENLLGYKKEELIGKNLLEMGLLSEKHMPKALEMLQKNMTGQKAGPEELELIRKNGNRIWVEISAIPVKRGGKTEVLGIARDITERKGIEKALKASEEKFRAISISAKDGMILMDNKGKVSFWNPAAGKIFGYTEEEAVGKYVHDLLACRRFGESIPKAMQEFVETGRSDLIGKTLELVACRKKGTEFPLELSLSAFQMKGKWHALGIVRDVTERKEMLKKLEEYSQQLEKMVERRTKQLRDTQEQLVKAERLATIGQVAAMIGHDLRNPLTGISGATYYLKMKLGPNAEKKMMEMLELIEKDIQYSNKIITDLMEYSREIRLELTETTPKSVIAESISVVQIPEKVQLVDSTQNEPTMKIDIDKMKRVFSNFIKNAVEAMPQGGKLAISSKASDSDVEFRFIDSGTGMTKEVMEKIWTPFFTTKAKGMGLGLAICRRMIEAHEGKISVESMVGEGTTFTITIPLEPKPRVEGGEKVWVNMPESLLSTMTKA